MLQVARFLTKCLKQLQQGKRLPESTMYLLEISNSKKFVCDCNNPDELRDPEQFRKIFAYDSC